MPGLAKRRRGPDGLTERSMLRRLLWKPTPNFRAGREEGSKKRVSGKGPGARFLKTLKTFRSRKDSKISNLMTTELFLLYFIHASLISTEVPFIEEVSGVYTYPF